jgi:hypothetical protein
VTRPRSLRRALAGGPRLALAVGFAAAGLPAARGLAAQPSLPPIVAVGDSVRVYEPVRLEGGVLRVDPAGLVVRSPLEGEVSFERTDLGRFEIYTGYLPRRGRILEGTLMGLGAGAVVMLPLFGQCENSCAVTGVAFLAAGTALIGGLIGGTTAGPQWKRARLPPAGDVEARGAAGGGAPAGGGVRITLLRLVV